MKLTIDIASQTLTVWAPSSSQKQYLVSTAARDVGEVNGSLQTPRGLHVIRAKIGADMPSNTVFIERRPTGEIFSQDLYRQFPKRDWILTRILWLSGLEVGKNRLGNVDTMQRYIYIHGTPDSCQMGQPGSHGCVRMRNQDIIELYEGISVGTLVEIIAV